MQIDNKKGTYSIWLQKFAITITMFPLIIVSSFSDFFQNPFLGFERVFWIILFCLLYLSVIIYHRIKNPHYVFYSDNGDKLVLRFYPIKAFNQKKSSIIIPKKKFVKYEVLGKGMSEKLIVYGIFKNGIGKYPEIPVNTIPKLDKARIYKSLNQYIKKLN